MSDLLPGGEPAAGPPAARRGVVHRFLRNPLAVTAAAVVTAVVLVAVFADVVAPGSPVVSRLDMVNAAPGGEYLLGGDGAGRDVLSRLVHAGRLTLLGAFLTVVVAMSIGVVTGLVAAYFAGWFDTVAGWAANLVIVLPGTIVLVSLFAVIGPNILVSMAVLGIMFSPNFFRLVRNQVIAVKNELYVDAARVSGLGDARIIARHILYVVRAPIIILSATIAAAAIVVQAGLEFIGLGDPATPTWGGMLQDAFANLYTGRHLFLPPGLAIGITVACFILLANGVRDALEGDESGARRRPPRARTAAPAVPDDRATEHVPDDALLTVSGLVVGYRTRSDEVTEVVHGVDLRVERGRIVGLVGESGSGKTQTALSVLGLLPEGGEIRSGHVALDGEDLARLSPRQMRNVLGRRIGYIPQEPMSNLDPSFRIGWQLVQPMRRARGLSDSAARAEAESLLRRVGITDPPRVMSSYPHQISGGMAQRVLIAGAISCNPALLIADEPTTALDVTVQAEILDLIRDLQRERGLGVLLVTHNFGVVADVCDRVAVMRSGRIVEERATRDIFADPHHPYTITLLGSTIEGAPLRAPLDEEVAP
ncbi:dipeptide/oligopeptide/nickel ABC transporter permease/ATP-binding protein [Pseudonocardia nematodicida]|uniref:Dipeptide/oligopeptide/nickel ABC transporter permease/ATP-binding protein n=1 Tax=Pseudonocardia nematodicida TaxID=1206997 RepID=A0ABV1KL23_9PSEU